MKRCLGCMEIYEDEYDICPYCGFVDGTEAEEKIHMDPGTILADRYIIGRVLGYGGFGVTYIGWDGKLEQKVAIKEYLPSEFSTRMPGQSIVTVFNGDKNEQYYEGLKKFIEEAKRLAKFQNEPGIVKVFDSFIENETAYIIMEYLDGETLTARLKREGKIPEEEAVQMLLPLMESLKVVHEEGILHRDIAPDNIFIVKNGDIKLIDFGASRYATTSHSRSLTVIIKPGYSPEEQYRSLGDQGPYTDVYALGACLYKMLTGKTPPDAMERRALFESKNKDILVAPGNLTKDISAVRENAILNAMNVRVEDRTPNVQEFIDELKSDVPIKRRNGRIKKIDVYKWPLWFKLMASVLVFVLISLGGLMATGVIKVNSLFSDAIVVPDGKVTVPEFEGLVYAKAIKLAEKNNLNVMVGGSISSDYVDAGKIVLQEPNSGLYKDANSIVYLTVSKGNGDIIKPVDGISTVPYLIGSSLEEASEDLSLAGLASPKTEYAYDENISEGLVINQSSEYMAQVEENSTITLVVSKGPEPFEMPNLYLASSEDVAKKLTQRGILIEYSYTESPDYAEGTVLSQGTAEGTLIRKLDTVSLEVVKSVWSEWSTTKPDSSKEIETKTQYSYSDLQTKTQVNNNKMDGWILDTSLTRTEKTGFGEWSNWSTTQYTASDNRKVENRTEYRYRDKEYTNSTESSLSGWTQTGSTKGYTDYSGWSDWSTNVVSNSDTQQIETRTTYRTRKKETKESFNSSESGWSQVGSYYSSSDWNDWSDWSDSQISGNDNRQVETRTLYRYYYYTCSNGCHCCAYGTLWAGLCTAYGGNCNSNTIYSTAVDFWSATPPEGTFRDNIHGTGTERQYCNNVENKGRAYLHVNQNGVASTKVQYRYRDKKVVYKYERWGNWSGWSTNSATKTSSLDVEQRTEYRYRTRSIVYTYSYEKWRDWSGWSTNAASKTDTREVESRTAYRYADKTEQTIYTFTKWSDYSEYSDDVVKESDTRKVQTREVYRYKTK